MPDFELDVSGLHSYSVASNAGDNGFPAFFRSRRIKRDVISYTQMKKVLDITALDFLDDTITDEIRRSLTVSSSQKVPCICARCRRSRLVTFFSVYRQRVRRGMYVCRSCQAKDNGRAGTDNLTGQLLPSVMSKRVHTNQQRFGVDHPMQDASRQTSQGITAIREYIQQYGHPMHDDVVRAKLQATNIRRYGVAYTGGILPHTPHPLSVTKTSLAESEIRHYLESITHDDWSPTHDLIYPKQVDGFNSTRKMAFEYNGLYWHSEKCGKTKQDHYQKYQACYAQGVQLITIFEDEWTHRPEQVKASLSAKVGIYHARYHARKLSCRPVSMCEAAAALNDWHLQKYTVSQWAWGLYDTNTLLGVMTFGKHPHRPQEPHLVLSRFACAPYTQIIGGASKLFSHAYDDFQCRGTSPRILSWSDNRWSHGHLYRTLGFTLDAELPPDYTYVDGKTTCRLTKHRCTRQLLGAAEHQTEVDRATELKLYRIWDCGKRRWIFSQP